ncbi:TlpA family protein disulfide reductase [Sphingomicrobium sediminis]|uniref:TlpA family protein disulfide reductase n=1 Tax=Sphingomicrobium sediminis TaxID=2950949 RepID=A0A9X2EI53_9SPHN|nr:TlpA disulfide reductase family protein [Sphingomicrobium sediminis]MCM8557931.1 TlpA family protein disulfide reductase [Sphingomicrobium sediminis]
MIRKQHLIALAALALAACGSAETDGQSSQPAGTMAGLVESEAGSQMPDIAVLAPDGEETTLAEIAGGEPILVNLWASWCAPCIEELPTLVALAAREDAPQVLMLNQDFQVPQASIRAFLDDNEIEGVETWQDPEMAMTDALSVTIMPTTVLYDGEGREVWRFVGDLHWDGEEAAELLARLD